LFVLANKPAVIPSEITHSITSLLCQEEEEEEERHGCQEFVYDTVVVARFSVPQDSM